jgi:hypothetical protein
VEENGMRKDRLRKFYDRLTPGERFRLYIEAIARGDEEEWRNLEKSCPRLVYEMNDRAYEDRVRTSEEITLAVCLNLAPRVATLKMLMALSDALPGLQNSCLYDAHMAYLRGYAAGIKWNQRSVNPGDDLPDVESPRIERDFHKIITDLAKGWSPFTDLLETLQQDVLKEVRGMWEAFSSFSRGSLGIEPEKLLKSWLEPMWPEIEKLVSISDYPVVNEKRMEEYALVLRRLWRKLTT